MEYTNLLKLPYIMANQAQKHVTHNEALRSLDSLIHISIQGFGEENPPDEPAEGDRFFLGAEPIGSWEGQHGKLAVFVDGAWMFHEPRQGWLAWDYSGAGLMVFDQENWVSVSSFSESVTDLSDLVWLGVNGVASEDERLVVQSNSVLFNHDGNDHRMKINKASQDDTATLVFQSEFSGRAEFGLAGENNFSIKVSPDGSTWNAALVTEADTGLAEFPSSGVSLSPDLVPNLLPDSGRFNPSGEQDQIEAPLAQAPSYLIPVNGSVFKFPFLFKNDNSTFGGVNGALNPVVRTLVEAVFGIEGSRFGPEFWCMKIEAGGGTDSEVSLSGQSYFRATNSMSGPRPIRYTTGFFVKAILGQLCLVSPEGEKIKLSRNGMPITYESSDVVVSPSDGWVYFEIQVLNSNNAADTNDMAVHLTAGGSCYFALPRVLPGWLSPGRNRAVVPNRYIAGT